MATTKKRQQRKQTADKTLDPSGPKTTRPAAAARREIELPKSSAARIGRNLDALPDRIDIRDWFYQPSLSPLPDRVVSCDMVPKILDQGREGACTGFALAAVVNYHLARRNLKRFVSPRMLYEMARKYDEWPGEGYDGSSARGAMKGWVAHGVCSDDSWPYDVLGTERLTQEVAEEAQLTPGGSYYRVMHRQIRDMHAALAEVGILYATLMVHAGWDKPGPDKSLISYVENGNYRELNLPIIRRKLRADSGHAVAIVGYTRDGFIIQNSWGTGWGEGGFALLPYEDYMLHATDVWLAQLGVPISLRNWSHANAADTTAGLYRATRAIPLSDIRPYVIDIGNNGELSNSGVYWTTVEDVERLFNDIIPEATNAWQQKRIMLYLHGGLNDETAVAQRIVAFKEKFLANEIYPLHIMWESGVWESLGGIIEDLFTDVDERAGGVADWLGNFREGLIEAKDRSLELTIAHPGGALWGEMKENARLASSHPNRKGGMQIIAQTVKRLLSHLDSASRKNWEIHIVGHSAGSIFVAHAMRHLIGLGFPLQTIQFMAPAITIDEFSTLLLPYIQTGDCPHPTLYLLSDVGERDDDVGPYGKSLLYLVSNAFEHRRETPLLGMERFVSDSGESSAPYEGKSAIVKLFQKQVDGLRSLVVAGVQGAEGSLSESDSHGGFDNDPATMNSILYRILGGAPAKTFELRDLQFATAKDVVSSRSRARLRSPWGTSVRR